MLGNGEEREWQELVGLDMPVKSENYESDDTEDENPPDDDATTSDADEVPTAKTLPSNRLRHRCSSLHCGGNDPAHLDEGRGPQRGFPAPATWPQEQHATRLVAAEQHAAWEVGRGRTSLRSMHNQNLEEEVFRLVRLGHTSTYDNVYPVCGCSAVNIHDNFPRCAYRDMEIIPQYSDTCCCSKRHVLCMSSTRCLQPAAAQPWCTSSNHRHRCHTRLRGSYGIASDCGRRLLLERNSTISYRKRATSCHARESAVSNDTTSRRNSEHGTSSCGVLSERICPASSTVSADLATVCSGDPYNPTNSDFAPTDSCVPAMGISPVHLAFTPTSPYTCHTISPRHGTPSTIPPTVRHQLRPHISSFKYENLTNPEFLRQVHEVATVMLAAPGTATTLPPTTPTALSPASSRPGSSLSTPPHPQPLVSRGQNTSPTKVPDTEIPSWLRENCRNFMMKQLCPDPRGRGARLLHQRLTQLEERAFTDDPYCKMKYCWQLAAALCLILGDLDAHPNILAQGTETRVRVAPPAQQQQQQQQQQGSHHSLVQAAVTPPPAGPAKPAI